MPTETNAAAEPMTVMLEVADPIMGTRSDADARFMAACDKWIRLRQPHMANAAAHKKRDAEEHEARFQLANAAIHLAWFMRNDVHPSDDAAKAEVKRSYPGGRTKDEWDKIAAASFQSAAHLPED